MGLFDTMRTAKVLSQGNYFPHPGDFLMEVQISKYQQNRSKIWALIFEMETIETNHVATEPGQVSAKPGDAFSYYLDSTNDYFDSDAIAFQLALFGFSPSQKDEIARFQPLIPARLETAVDPKLNAYEKMRVRVSTKPKITKANKNVITQFHWRPFYESHAEAEAVYQTNMRRAPGTAAAPPPPPPPPGADPRASWQKSPDGLWLLDPSKNDWVRA